MGYWSVITFLTPGSIFAGRLLFDHKPGSDVRARIQLWKLEFYATFKPKDCLSVCSSVQFSLRLSFETIYFSFFILFFSFFFSFFFFFFFFFIIFLFFFFFFATTNLVKKDYVGIF